MTRPDLSLGRIFALFTCALAPTLAQPAAAETTRLLREVVQELRIEIDAEIDQDARDCGITDLARYQLAARDALEAAGYSYDAAAEHVLYIDFVAFPVEDQDLCTGTVVVFVNRWIGFEGLSLPLEYYYAYQAFHAKVVDTRDFLRDALVLEVGALAEAEVTVAQD